MPPNTNLDIPVMASDNTVNTPDLNDITHPPLRMTPDKSTIIELNEAAGSIIVGNPAHLNIMADSATRLIAVPRAQGASFFTVLGKEGNVIMQRHVIVGSTAGPDNKYMRVRRVCAGGSANCQQTSVYYCPDMCHEISVEQTGSGSGNSAEALEGGTNINIDNLPMENPQSSQLPPPPPPAEETLSNE